MKRVRGTAFTERVSPGAANRMVDAARGALNALLPDVYVFTDHRSGKDAGGSPGFGLSLVAETTTGCVLAADAASAPPDASASAAQAASAASEASVSATGSGASSSKPRTSVVKAAAGAAILSTHARAAAGVRCARRTHGMGSGGVLVCADW